MEYTQIQEMLLTLLPLWNYRIAKPFKQLLDEGIRQQMTQMVNRMIDINCFLPPAVFSIQLYICAIKNRRISPVVEIPS